MVEEKLPSQAWWIGKLPRNIDTPVVYPPLLEEFRDQLTNPSLIDEIIAYYNLRHSFDDHNSTELTKKNPVPQSIGAFNTDFRVVLLFFDRAIESYEQAKTVFGKYYQQQIYGSGVPSPEEVRKELTKREEDFTTWYSGMPLIQDGWGSRNNRFRMDDSRLGFKILGKGNDTKRSSREAFWGEPVCASVPDELIETAAPIIPQVVTDVYRVLRLIDSMFIVYGGNPRLMIALRNLEIIQFALARATAEILDTMQVISGLQSGYTGRTTKLMGPVPGLIKILTAAK